MGGTGALGFLRFAWDTVPRVPMAFGFEVTNRPDADDSPVGTRLIFDLGVEVTTGFRVDTRVGYATRAGAYDGGPVLGLGTVLEF